MFQEKSQDSVIITKLNSIDEKTFKELFETYAESLLNFSFRFVRDRQIAEDIVQGVFVKIWINRKKLEPISSLKAYLFSAVRNSAFQHLRHETVKQKSEATIQSLNPTPYTPEQEIQEKELLSIIKNAIEELPEKCKNIFKMNRFDGLSYSEIAEVENISINTVKTQMGRAFKFLRKRIIFLLK